MDENEEVVNNNALFEAEVCLKEGLQNRWQKTYSSVYTNLLIIYKNQSKEKELFRFSPRDSWISSSIKSENGLFVLNTESHTTFYLFETGSDLVLQTWLRVLHIAGWKSAMINNNLLSFRFKPNDTRKFEYNSVSLNPRPQLKEYQVGKLERSLSLPMLMATQYKNSLLADEGVFVKNDPTTKRRSYIRLNDDPDMVYNRRIYTSISESGYCSKESLTLESERNALKQRKDQVTDNLHFSVSETMVINDSQFPEFGASLVATIVLNNFVAQPKISL